MKFVIVLFIVISVSVSSFSYETFIRSIRLPYSAIPYSAIELENGEFAIGGFNFFIKIDSMGNVLSSNQFDRFHIVDVSDFCEYQDSLIYSCGRYLRGLSILKFNEYLNFEMGKEIHFDWTPGFSEIGLSADGFILITGTTMSDNSYILKLNPIRSYVEWLRSIYLSYPAASIWRAKLVASSDSGVFVASTFFSIPCILGSIALVKFDKLGNTEWIHTYNWTGFLTCYTALSYGNGVILGGSHIDSDIALLFIDSLGNIKRAYTVGDTSSFMCEMAISMVRDDDSNIVILSAANDISPVTGQRDFLVLKIDTLGNVSWAYTIGGPADEIPVKLIKCSAGGFLAVGITTTYPYGDSSIFIVRLDENGRTSCIQEPYFPMVFDCRDSICASPVTVTVSAASCSVSNLTSIIESMPVSVVNPCSTLVYENNNSSEMVFEVYPNPFNKSCFISIPADEKFIITDINGRIISDGIRRLNNGKYLWMPSQSVSSGIYFISLKSDFGLLSRKILFIK